MDTNTIIQIAVLLAVGGLLLLAAIAASHIITQIRIAATPTEQAILDALMVYAQRGIVAGEKLSVEGLDQVDRELTGADKAAIANSIYNLLPDTITVLGHSYPVSIIKHLITPDQFSALVKQIFDETDAFILRNRDYLEKQIPPDVPVTPNAQAVQAQGTPVKRTLVGDPLVEASVG